MSDKAWKQFERAAANLFGGNRKWANSGEEIDFETDRFVGQCKNVQSLSLQALSDLAERTQKSARSKTGVVCVKLRGGRGRPSPTLVVFTAEGWLKVWREFSAGLGGIG